MFVAAVAIGRSRKIGTAIQHNASASNRDAMIIHTKAAASFDLLRALGQTDTGYEHSFKVRKVILYYHPSLSVSFPPAFG